MSLTGLSEIAESKVLDDLGKLAAGCNGPFCCSGELEESVIIVYNSKGQWNAATFPSDNQETLLSGLIEASSAASFGVGGQTVTDATYRNALKLEPERFLTNIQPSNASVLPLLLKTLVPNMRSIRAQLYKLNIYGTGGHFRPHVDTPKSPEMFGSLVLCLPTQFTGGSLVLHHHEKEVVFDWSSTPDHPAKTIKWAAFFSNIEHEILPVISGHRVTLTYNLYSEGSEIVGLPIYSPELAAFKQHILRALGSPHFMRKGGILGFRCQHSYVFNTLNDQKLLPWMLKGADYNIVVEVKSLGIPVVVKPYINFSGYEEMFYISDKFRKFRANTGCTYYGDNCPEEQAPYDVFGTGIIKDHMIKWCQSFSKSSWEPAGAVVMYGNEATVGVLYQAAAILIGIPKWGKSRQILAGVCDEEKDVQAVDAEEMDAESVDETSDEEDSEKVFSDKEDSDKVFMKIFGQRLD